MTGDYGERSAPKESTNDYRTHEPTGPPRRDIAAMSPQERFDYAKSYRVGFGRYKGMELNQIAADGQGGDEAGLLYIDWLYRQEWLNEACRGAVDAFCNWEPVTADLEKAVERDAIKRSARAG